MPEYKERDHMLLDKGGNYYSKHVLAMTQEGLHDKSDIAAELAYRDMITDELREVLKDAHDHLIDFYRGDCAHKAAIVRMKIREALGCENSVGFDYLTTDTTEVE